MKPTQYAITLSVAALIVLLAGCNSDGKYPVKGSVTWEGEPIPEDHNGFVTLTPTDPTIAPDAGPILADGTFNFRASPGKKRVEIEISRPKGEVVESMGMAAQEQYIPVRFNKESELTATVEKGSNTLDFDLVK